MPTKFPPPPVAVPAPSSRVSLWRDDFVFWRPDLPVMVQRNEQCNCASHRHEFVAVVFILVLHGLALELLGRLGRFATESGGGPDAATLRRQRLRAAFELLERQYAENVSLARLAQAVHLSPRSVERHFREAAGQSPLRYRNAVTDTRET